MADISDHFPCLLSLQLEMSPNKESPLYKFTGSINDEKFFAMNNELPYKDWTHLLDYDVDDSYANLSEEITTVLNKHAALVLKRIQPRDICKERWVTKALLKSSKKLKRYYCASLNLSKDDEKYRKYIRYQNAFNVVKRYVHESYCKQRLVDHNANAHKLWQVLKELINKSHDKTNLVDKIMAMVYYCKISLKYVMPLISISVVLEMN